MKKIAKVVAILSLSMLGTVSIAAVPGSYFGVGIGPSKLNTSNKSVTEAIRNAKQSKEENGLGGRLFVGYNFNRYLGYEIGLAHYAPSNFKNNLNPAAFASINYTLNAADLVAKGYIPFGDSGFNLYGLGGLALVRSTVKYDVSVGGQQQMHGNKTQNKFRPVYGLGASYDIPRTKFTTNVEFSRIQGIGNVKTSTKAIPSTNLLTFNLAVNFD